MSAPPGERRLRMLAAIDACENELARHNALPAGRLALRFGRLRALLSAGRLARIAAVGRRGAGKSSLLNAVAGAELAHVGDVEDATRSVTWQRVAWGARAVEWLDTPGLRAGGERDRRGEVSRALAQMPPDVVLFLCQATEVDAGIDDDLADLVALLAALRRESRAGAPALFGVVTKIDELAPPDASTPPYDDPEKRANMRHAVSLLGRHMRRLGAPPLGVVPLSAYQQFERGRVAHDLRWNVDALVARVTHALPHDARLAGTLLVPELRGSLAAVMSDVTDAFASVAAAVASRPRGPGRRTSEVSYDLASVNDTMLRVLRALAPADARPSAFAAAVESLARPDGAMEFIRAGAARMGASGTSGALASARVRALGAATVSLLLGGIEDAALAALFDPPRIALDAPGEGAPEPADQ